MEKINLYTDGSSDYRTRLGGWAFIIKSEANNQNKDPLGSSGYMEVSGFASDTTNNRMELTGVIQGLRTLIVKSRVNLFSDSQYVTNGISLWLPNWARNGHKQINGDLWAQVYELVRFHEVKVNWVRGHSGHPENELCDKLAKAARLRGANN